MQGILHTIPDSQDGIMVREFIKNTVSSHYNKVMWRIYLERSNFRIRNNDIRISSKLRKFRFGISKRPADGEPSRQNSLWANYNLWLVRITINRNSGSMINLTAICDNSLLFRFLRRFMVCTQPIKNLNQSLYSSKSIVPSIEDGSSVQLSFHLCIKRLILTHYYSLEVLLSLRHWRYIIWFQPQE